MDWHPGQTAEFLTVSFHDPTLIRLEHAAKCHVAQIGEEVYVR
jgi:hypothetical protein